MTTIAQRPGWQIVRAMRAARVTQEDVAKKVGRHRTVVSAVIQRRPGVAPTVREAVWRELRRLLKGGA